MADQEQEQIAPKKFRRDSFWKKKSLWLILFLIVAGAGYWYYASHQASKIEYELFTAEQRTLVQSVEVTGEIKPAARIDLAFETNGTLSEVLVKTGEEVKRGQVLAKLQENDLTFAYRRAQASYAMASANLNLRLAGETIESIRVSEAQVEQAQAAYDKAISDLDNTRIQAQNDLENAKIALETAQNNLNNTSPISNQILINAIETAKASLLGSLGPLQTALIDGDTVSGVDDTATNQMYRTYLGALEDGSLERSRQSYKIAKASKNSAEQSVNTLSSASTKQEVLNSTDLMLIAIRDVQQFLLDVQTVLSNTITSTYFTQAQLDAKKTVINSDYGSVTAQKTTVNSAKQSVLNADLSKTAEQARLEDAYSAAKIAYNIALTNIDLKMSSASSSVDIQKAALESAQASLAFKKATPRDVDLAGLRAQVAEAKVALDQAADNLSKSQVLAPVDGVITDVVSDIGERVTAYTPQIRMIGTEQYDILAQVPEANITKVKVGQQADITLDAHGDDVKFTGYVTSENPDQTVILDAIYYDVRVQIDPRDMEIKPGMTANVTIVTNKVDDAIVIPLRAIRTDSETGKRSIRVLINDQPVERQITLGIRGDEGRVEVIDGVMKGDQIILREL
jgi:HlyD family secretion protein